MTPRQKYQSTHGLPATIACYDPLLKIEIMRIAEHWSWYVLDINAKVRGENYGPIAQNTGYDDPREAMEDALVALAKSEGRP